MSRSKLLPTAWQVPEYFHSRLGDRVGRQRAMVDNRHLLLVLHGPADRESRARVAKLFYRRPDGNWCSNAEGSSHAALVKHLHELEQVIEELDIREDKAQTAERVDRGYVAAETSVGQPARHS